MSLTPSSRSQEATTAAANEGFFNAVLTLIPSFGLLYYGMHHSPTFVKRTNWQSRTALAIMPAWFVFELTSHHKLSHTMRNMAHENQFHEKTVEWAEQQVDAEAQKQQFEANKNSTKPSIDGSPVSDEKLIQLRSLYKQSIEMSSDVNIVPGNSLSLFHQFANFTADNPIKVLCIAALPAVGYIFYGNSGKEHLTFSIKLLHTRVFGQFATISLLLSVMGFKDYMDRHGRYITEADAAYRVEEMQQIRHALQSRLEHEKQQRAQRQLLLSQAHEADLAAAISQEPTTDRGSAEQNQRHKKTKRLPKETQVLRE
jgi:hypothetical protein